MALFSDRASADEKTAIVAAFWRPAKTKDLRRVEAKKTVSFREVQLVGNFETERLLNIFTALNLERSFPSSKPDTWSSRQDYLNAVETVSALRVVNDCAETAVEAATYFISDLQMTKGNPSLCSKS